MATIIQNPAAIMAEPTTITGEAAALELWDMIHAAPPASPKADTPTTSQNRFASAQHSRTLHHPKLPQPPPPTTSNEEKIQEPEAMLRKRLSEALLAAAPDGTLLNSDMESPTSTLQFPSSSNLQLNNNNENAPSVVNDDDIFFYPPSDTIYVDEEHHHYDDNVVVVSSSPSYEDEQLNKHNNNDTMVVSRGSSYLDDAAEEAQGSNEMTTHSKEHTFVVCADTQLGMTSSNQEWETELEYSRQAVKYINSLDPRPMFCCVCGDLVDMEHTFYTPRGFSRQQCNDIQDKQMADFQEVWSEVHPDIALVCLCGNHDVGNRPTWTSISRFTREFGDDYLGFWVNGTYNLVLNSCLFSNPVGAQDLYREQLFWMEGRLKYASDHGASQIFVFGHHPWFLYHEDEDVAELKGICQFPEEWGIPGGFPDYYFHVPKPYRHQALDLFRKYKVRACFSGHFHQNLVSNASWGMQMIITAPLSMLFDSTGKGIQPEPDARGLRVVTVNTETDTFGHSFETI